MGNMNTSNLVLPDWLSDIARDQGSVAARDIAFWWLSCTLKTLHETNERITGC